MALVESQCGPGVERCDDSLHVASPLPFFIVAGAVAAIVLIGAVWLWRARRL
jgi:hypothetical protein